MSLFDSTPELFKSAMAGPNDHEEDKTLVTKMQQGDLTAYKQLRRKYQPVIHRMALDWRPSSGDVSLAQIKMRAEYEFPKILMKYNPTHEAGANVMTYVKSQLSGQMQNLVGEHVTGPYVSRSSQAKGERYRQALREAEREFGPSPTDEQILRFFSDPEVRTVADVNEYKRYSHVSYIGDVQVGKDDDNNFLFRDQFTTKNTADDPNDLYHDMALDRVKQVMQEKLTPQEYAVVKGRVIDDKSMAQVAIENGISTTKLRSILERWNQVKRDEGLVK